jgi:rare lipoprotein A
MVVLAAVLAGCAAGPPRAPASGRDGAEAHPPADLARVPDAEPRLEPIRAGGPNKPYDVLGRNYVPITRDAPYTERGLASWYGRKFQGRRTASGEIYNMYAMTAAHPTLPIPSYARVRNPANGREVVVRINDRGPFHAGRIIDLSYTAALKLDLLRGVAPVELQRITFDDIRTGAWRREGGADAVRVASNDVADGDAPGTQASAPATQGLVLDASLPAVAAMSASVVTTAPNTAPTIEPSARSSPAPASKPTVVLATSSTPTLATAPTPEPITAPRAAAAEAVADAPTERAYTRPARGFWVQLGAFRVRDGAERFQQRVGAELDWLSPLLAVFSDASLFRLQAGPYPSHDEARRVAERVRTGLKLVPTIVERR